MSKESRPRIVVGAAAAKPSPRQSLRRVAWLLAMGLAGVAIGTQLMELAPIGGPDASAVRELRERNDRLARELAIARRGAQVTAEASDRLKAELVALQSEVAELRADVAFYQRLVGAGGDQRGLAVHDLQLLPTGSPRVYRFRLMLSQNLEKARVVEGGLSFSAEGVLEDRMVELDGDDLTIRLAGEGAMFRFKYFQEFDGSFSLPEGFLPERLLVRLDAESRSEPVIRRFEWQELIIQDAVAASNAEGN